LIEVEAKVEVKDLQPLRRRLKELGARYTSKELQRDTYFNHPQRDFASTDEALRVRSTSRGEHSITYKGAKLPESKVKAREELNLQVTNAEVAAEILFRLGFKEVAHVVKKREVWALQGLTVCLDEVEGLGSFVEVEAAERGEASSSEEAALRLIHQLGLGSLSLIRESYLELILKRRD